MIKTGNREQKTAAETGTPLASNAQVVTQIAAAPGSKAPAAKDKMTLAEVRTKLEGKSGRRFWKSLDEISSMPGFREMLESEFPRQAGEWVDAVSRRGFLKVMGASLALAGMAGCTKQPDEPIFPYVKQPEDLILGKPMYFASAHPFPTGAIPVLVKSDAFRPIKVDGNPDHPISKGRSDALTQATLLDLYDPDRSPKVLQRGQESSWAEFQKAFTNGAKGLNGGQGLYFLSETITSPTLAAQWKQVQQKYPQAMLVQWDPINRDSAMAASKAAFGDYTDAQYKLENADIILSLDADFLGGIAHPGFLPMAAAFAERRRFDPTKTMNRMYAVETMPTVTGMKADHRLAVKPSDLVAFAQQLAGGGMPSFQNPDAMKFFMTLQQDLKAANGRAVVIPGEQTPPEVHLAAYAINAAIGAVGKTVVYSDTVNPLPSEQVNDLKSLVGDMLAGKVKWLVMLGVNPLYSAPRDLEFETAFNKVPNTAHLDSHVDETGSVSVWHVNKAHYLESWSDARAYDGTISIIQPMIAPLYGGHSAHEVLQALLDDPEMSAYDAVRANAKTYLKGDFETAWRTAVHAGWVDGTAFTSTKTPKAVAQGSAGKAGAAIATPVANEAVTPQQSSTVEVSFKADPSLYDGRYANNGWLQELPKQITNLSWDNAALMSLQTAEDLGVNQSDAIEIDAGGRKVIAPVLIAPGHADGAVTVHLGFGRREGGRVGPAVGFDSYLLRTTTGIYTTSAKLRKTGDIYDICVTKVNSIEHRGGFAQQDLNQQEYDTQGTFSLPGHEAMERAIIRYATYDEAKKDPGYAKEGGPGALVNKVGYAPEGEAPGKDESFFPDAWRYDHKDVSSGQLQNKWGIAVDLNSCIGCNACVVSCYAENNIPVVGRAQVKIYRNMQWLRIDTYFEGDLHTPRAHFQPMMCQQCENAGCEQVCPVGATVHSPEGLNVMAYNRCVGTRYCQNNCVYKVRRFNFLLYSDFDTESLKLMRNPDVSVRSRGVMEKCTYCVQRIQEAKITADKENRAIKDGEIVTACQQACPTDAIVFGNLNDPNSKVSQRKATERDYQVLADLNYRPRTTYTAGVINPNPELA